MLTLFPGNKAVVVTMIIVLTILCVFGFTCLRETKTQQIKVANSKYKTYMAKLSDSNELVKAEFRE